MGPAKTAPHIARARLVDVVACCIRAQVPVVIIGHPGLGKSASAKAVFNAFGWKWERKGIPGITDPILIGGLPGQDGERTKIKPFPEIARLMAENDAERPNGLIFDDIAEGSRLIQTALLDVLGEGVIGGHHMKLTSMVATANPIGGGLQVTPSMANRVAHLPWTITPKEQADLMEGDYPTPDIPKFEEKWGERLPMTRREIAGFLRTLGDFNAPDLDGATVALTVGAYPSARTWELSARVLAAIDASNMKPDRAKMVRILAVKALVGDVAANAFFTFLQYPDMPRPEDVLRNPRLVLGRQELFQPDRPDRAFIFLAALTRFTVATNTVDAWNAAWEVLGHFAKRDAVPVCAAFAVILDKRRPEGAQDRPADMSHFREVLAR